MDMEIDSYFIFNKETSLCNNPYIFSVYIPIFIYLFIYFDPTHYSKPNSIIYIYQPFFSFSISLNPSLENWGRTRTRKPRQRTLR